MSVRFDTQLPASSRLQLQVCGQCQQINYPPRELCGSCLADALSWQEVDNTGTVQSLTALHYSLEQTYAQHLPWKVGSIALGDGTVLFTHLQEPLELGDRVGLQVKEDCHGNRMLVALAVDEPACSNTSAWLESKQFKEVNL